MYVCSKCNVLVGQPKKRWWSGWRYCEDGHVLYIRGLGPSLEQSFWKSFLKGLARSIGVVVLIALTLAVAPDYPADQRAHAGSAAVSVGFVVAAFYSLIGLHLLRKAHVWAVRAGPVRRLVPHARGRAYGFLAVLICPLATMIALLFAK